MAISCDPAALVQAAKCFSCVPRQARRWVKAYLLCNYGVKVSGFGAGIANAWALRVVANGGAMPSSASISAVANFADTLNNAGVWSKMLDVNVFAPDSLIATLTPILITDGLTLWGNTGPFVAGDLTVNGLKGDGIAKCLNTGINLNPKYVGNPPTVFIGVSLYVTQASDANACDWGWTQNNYGFYVSFGGTLFFDCFGTGTGRLSAANAAFTGFLSASRTDFAHSAVYKASSTIPFQTLVSTAANNTNQAITNNGIQCFANEAAGPLQFSPRRLSFVAHHLGLSSGDAQTLFNAVQALRTALGGGFV